MVNLGPLIPVACPNGAACPHDLEDHRYEPDRRRWVCTGEDCKDNPYRVIRVDPQNVALFGGSRYVDLLRSVYPEAHVVLSAAPPPPFQPDYDLLGEEYARSERRRRLGLKWWQRDRPRHTPASGAQVIDTPGLPDGYSPPSASLRGDAP